MKKSEKTYWVQKNHDDKKNKESEKNQTKNKEKNLLLQDRSGPEGGR